MPKFTKISTHELQGQIFTEIWYIPSRSQMQHNLPKYPRGQTDFYTMKCLKLKKVTLQLTWMSFLQNCKVCFNQERWLISYHNFRHKSLVRPKSKSPNWQESQPISYKAKFSRRDNTYLVQHNYNLTYQNILGKTKVRPIFIPWTA